VSDLASLRFRPSREEDRAILREMTVEGFDGVSIDQNIDRTLGPIAGRDWAYRKGRHVDDDFDAPGGEILVAEDAEGRPVGYVSMRLDPAAKVGQIPNVVVSASMRGRGLGRLLLEKALQRFREAGLTVARIETLAQNPVGSHLYPSVGFIEVARQIHFAMSLVEPEGDGAGDR
jgi:ribosomal protein S18 acetylase RimI-like enzyme